LRLTNGLGFGDTAFVSAETAGLCLLEACQRSWHQAEAELNVDMLTHLAGGIPAFESLIDPTHSRFSAPENILLEIKGFCKDTGQPFVEKPAAVYRCVVESLVMLYWKTLHAMEHVTGSGIQRLFLFNPPRNPFFAHLLANALRIPVVLLPADTTAVGSIVVQAMALGHLKTVENAGALLRNSVKAETIMPQPTSWEAVNERFLALCTVNA
jgi:sugar (pentulose or hexulose) kinase